MVTGQDEIPNEVSGLRVLKRHDLATLHEEADVIIVQQACMLGTKEGRQVTDF